MKSFLPPLTAAALFALAACNNNQAPEVLDSNPDPLANQLANAAPVALPPSITAEKTFRCKDNSLAYVTFFSGNTQVFVRTVKDGTPTTLLAPAEGDPYVAEGGWKVTGTPESITLEQPGKPSLTCRA